MYPLDTTIIEVQSQPLRPPFPYFQKSSDFSRSWWTELGEHGLELNGHGSFCENVAWTWTWTRRETGVHLTLIQTTENAD